MALHHGEFIIVPFFSELTIQLGKRDEKLKKKDMLLDEERSERESLEKERNALRKEVKDLTKLADQQKAQLAKKEKTIKETTDEMEEYKSKLDMIFNMSKK